MRPYAAKRLRRDKPVWLIARKGGRDPSAPDANVRPRPIRRRDPQDCSFLYGWPLPPPLLIPALVEKQKAPLSFVSIHRSFPDLIFSCCDGYHG